MKKHLLFSILSLLGLTLNAATQSVTVKNYSFTPSTLSVKAGDTVIWSFTGGTHTTTSGSNCTSDGKWDSGDKSSGTFSFVFKTVGSYPYFCTPHCSLGMTGTITVTAATGIELSKYNDVKISNFPNPFKELTNIVVASIEPSTLNINIRDLNGRNVFTKENLKATNGENNYPIDLSGINSGMYIMQLYSNGIPLPARMIIKD